MAKRTPNPKTKMTYRLSPSTIPIPMEPLGRRAIIRPPFKGLTKIILISNKGEGKISTSFNNLPNEYMPEVEKLIRKLSCKFGKKVVKYLKKCDNAT